MRSLSNGKYSLQLEKVPYPRSVWLAAGKTTPPYILLFKIAKQVRKVQPCATWREAEGAYVTAASAVNVTVKRLEEHIKAGVKVTCRQLHEVTVKSLTGLESKCEVR